jgi:LysM repeat protein
LLLCALSAFINPLAAQTTTTATLKGSPQSMQRQYQLAVSYGYTFLQTPSAVRNFAQEGYLVEVKPSSTVELADVSYPYARPEVKLFVERFSEQYVAACGEKLTVTSLTRPINLQPANASEASVHPTGMAVDLRVPQAAKCRTWLETTLLSLENTGVLDVTREYYPPHFHVAIYTKIYSNYVAALGTGSAGASEYIVRRGDTLSKIAASTGASLAALRSANALRNDLINVGQKLQIPGQSTAPATLAVAPVLVAAADDAVSALPVQAVAELAVRNAAIVQRGNGSYTVRRGDTLTKIADDTGTTIAALRRSNGLRGNLIHPGQTLQIPGQVAVEPALASVAQTSIAQTTVAQAPVTQTPVTAAPAIQTQTAPEQVAQASLPANATSYTVLKGDTLTKIAELANTSVAELRRVNGIRSSVIQVGQTLQLPGREVAAGIAAQVAQTAPVAQAYAAILTPVAKGGVSATALAGANTVSPVTASPVTTSPITDSPMVADTPLASTVVTAATDTTLTRYSVRKGDTLVRIAERTGTDIATLRRANGLRGDLLQVGQTLSVPTLAALTPSAHDATVHIEHEVRRGDSLWNIANRYGTTVNILQELNHLADDSINIGQVLHVAVGLRTN